MINKDHLSPKILTDSAIAQVRGAFTFFVCKLLKLIIFGGLYKFILQRYSNNTTSCSIQVKDSY